jgi:tetratricopeptide (TPR) repeat protein
VTPLGRAAAAGLVALAALGCRREAVEPKAGSGSVDPTAEARTLVEQRRFDEAIAQLGAGTDADTLYLLGRAWAGKAETAPLPTPAPGTAAVSGAALKPEEARALAFYERAVAARPDHAGAHLAIAELLAPHALAAAGPRGGGASATGGGGDVSVDRVLRSFGEAIQADPSGTAALEAMIRFATRAGRWTAADGGFQELIQRRREDPDLLVRYGDFLSGPGGNPEAALARYAQALLWRPDDASTRVKMAEIHLATAASLLARQQYAAAEAQLRAASRFATDPASPQAARLRELEGRLREIRGR